MSSPPGTRSRRIALILLLVTVFAGCGHEPVRRVSGDEARSVRPTREGDSTGEQAARAAIAQLGVPYRYGGDTPRGFDCSGLVRFAWQQAGVSIPRTTSAQWSGLAPVSASRLREGDVLFFRIDGRVSHVGLYLGGKRFVHAPSTGRDVSVERLDSDFYGRTFVRGGRPSIR